MEMSWVVSNEAEARWYQLAILGCSTRALINQVPKSTTAMVAIIESLGSGHWGG